MTARDIAIANAHGVATSPAFPPDVRWRAFELWIRLKWGEQ